jgi:hypothetical protein
MSKLTPKTQGFVWRSLLTTRRYLSMAVGLLLLTLLTLLFGIWPQIQSVMTGWSTLQKQQQVVERLERKTAELEQVPLSQAYSKAEQVSQTLPSGKQLLSLLSALNTVVTASQVRVTQIELSPGSIATESAQVAAPTTTSKTKKKVASTKPKEEYDSIDIELTIEGSLPSINGFLDRIESTAPLMLVTDLSLSQRANKDAPAGQFQATLVVSSYYFTKTVSAALEAPLPQLGSTETESLAALAKFAYPTRQSATSIQGGGLDDLFGVQLREAIKEE